MFLKHAQIAPARISHLMKAVESAVRAIPPAFPLEATVAVNPFLGQTGEDLATASARLGRVAGVRATQAGADYAAAIRAGKITDADIAEALAAASAPAGPEDVAALKARAEAPGLADPAAPYPTVADLAARATGTDWPSIIEKTV